jgi:hypothetical protein
MAAADLPSPPGTTSVTAIATTGDEEPVASFDRVELRVVGEPGSRGEGSLHLTIR